MNAPIDVTNIRIGTDRLILRPICQEDLPALHEIWTNPEVVKFSGWEAAVSLEEIQKRMNRYLESNAVLAVVLKETGKMIGTFAIQERNWQQYPIERGFRGREFGFDLNMKYWGRGLMPEALNAVTDYCFRELHYDFLTCGHVRNNMQSARCIQKCGYTFLFENMHTMPTGKQENILTYIRYNLYKK